MKINSTQILLTYSGQPMKDRDGKDATLRWACCEALTATFQDEKNLSGEDKIKRYVLAGRIFENDNPDLTVKEVALVIELVAKAFSTPIAAPALMILDPAADLTEVATA